MNWGVLVFTVFAAVAFIQILYYLLFFSRVASYKIEDTGHSQTHPVSVIICSRDEHHNLTANLPSVLDQDYPTTHEIIVVNDNSVDDSKYILTDLKKEHKQLQVVSLEQEAKMIPGKKFPLSIGIKEAKHEILLLTDADCIPASRNWIAKMQAAFRPDVEVVLGYGAYNKLPGLLNKIIRWETFHTALQYFSYALSGLPYMGVGRNLSYKKDLFYRNKGFSSLNNIASGDDDLFINKVATKKNTTVVIDPEAYTLSMPKRTWRDWLRQKKRHYTTGKYYKFSHQFLLGMYALTLFFFYPLFVASMLLYDWRWTLIPLGLRLLIQAVVLKNAMKRLNESDLWPWFVFLDIWMFGYYIIFAPTLLWKKPRKTWN